MSFYDDEEQDRKRHRSIEQSQRVGMHRGRAARTYHVHFASVRIGDGKTSAGGTVDYLARDGDFKSKNDDLEHIAGNAERVKDGARVVEATARIRNGPNAERVLVKQTIELPRELDQAGRAEVAERIVEAWKEKGHWAVAAVHGNDQVQPHIHVAVTARPIVLEAEPEPRAYADRDPTKTLLNGKAAVRAERQRIADLINQVLDERQVDAPRFHGGRDREMDVPGIQGRIPERRLPMRAWYIRQERSRDPQLVAETRARAEQQRQQAAEAAKARKQERRKQRVAWRQRHRVVPQGVVDTLQQQLQDEYAEIGKRDAELRQVRQNSAKALDYAWDRVTAQIRSEGGDLAQLHREEFDARMNTDPEYAGMVWSIVRESDAARKAQQAATVPQEPSQRPGGGQEGSGSPPSPSRPPQPRPRRRDRGIEMD